MTGRIRLHLPHPRRTARQRRADRERAIEVAVRRAGLDQRRPQDDLNMWQGRPS